MTTKQATKINFHSFAIDDRGMPVVKIDPDLACASVNIVLPNGQELLIEYSPAGYDDEQTVVDVYAPTGNAPSDNQAAGGQPVARMQTQDEFCGDVRVHEQAGSCRIFCEK